MLTVNASKIYADAFRSKGLLVAFHTKRKGKIKKNIQNLFQHLWFVVFVSIMLTLISDDINYL